MGPKERVPVESEVGNRETPFARVPVGANPGIHVWILKSLACHLPLRMAEMRSILRYYPRIKLRWAI